MSINNNAKNCLLTINVLDNEDNIIQEFLTAFSYILFYFYKRFCCWPKNDIIHTQHVVQVKYCKLVYAIYLYSVNCVKTLDQTKKSEKPTNWLATKHNKNTEITWKYAKYSIWLPRFFWPELLNTFWKLLRVIIFSLCDVYIL